MDGNAFLFRIPNAASLPLELGFLLNASGILKAGDLKFLHLSTANKTNLEVAKVFTIIDPRKPLPEVVNVRFQSGEVWRVNVASPWMPQVCSHCKEIGHSIKRCKKAPPTYSICKSSAHSDEKCTRSKSKQKSFKGKASVEALQGQYIAVSKKLDKPASAPLQKDSGNAKSGKESYFNQSLVGESSAMSTVVVEEASRVEKANGKGIMLSFLEAEPESSDVESTDSEEGELRDKEDDFI
ncbi:uncharacterized protein LOC112085265 [Eutrema salsugineum]|uniref:uncharacterized protein LOC112085265 n=1 Tax=Eutrema salsugineum TaxID=72664 RepID=UPI000CECF083|nr:uncharacterized protein LOC112085265 [Eutrema salsugineum]